MRESNGKSVMNRETVVVHQRLAGAIQQFSYDLSLTFTPTYVVVRNVSYGNGAGVAGILHSIRTPWIKSKDDILLTFTDDVDVPYQSNPQSHFEIQHPGSIMNGQMTFYISALTNGVGANTATGDIAFTLEFCKEQKERDIADVIITQMTQLTATLVRHQAQSVSVFMPPGDKGGITYSDAQNLAVPNLPHDSKERGLLAREQRGGLDLPDRRNAHDQVDPIPDVHRELESPDLDEIRTGQQDGLKQI